MENRVRDSGASSMKSGDKENQQAELQRLRMVLDVAKRNGNQLFIENIEREIAAVERGECSPLIEEYLTEEERATDRPQ